MSPGDNLKQGQEAGRAARPRRDRFGWMIATQTIPSRAATHANTAQPGLGSVNVNIHLDAMKHEVLIEETPRRCRSPSARPQGG